MNRLIITLLLTFLGFRGLASHIVGGEMIYEYVGPGSLPNTKQYRITLKLFRDKNCENSPQGCAAMPSNVFIGIFNNNDGSQINATPSKPYYEVSASPIAPVPKGDDPLCIQNPPNLIYHMATYTTPIIELPDNAKGYTAAYQTCCRVSPLMNVVNNLGGGSNNGTGSTYSCQIPGTGTLPATQHNNSPQFAEKVSVICDGRNFSLDFSAKDADGDELVYSFIAAYNGGATKSAANVNPAPPAYGSVPYTNGFTALNPLGDKATINPQTGIISGIAPPKGKYVVSVQVQEFRNGKYVSEHRKDFIVNVDDCDFAGATLEPSYMSCDDSTYTFENLNNSTLNKTYLWDFGAPGTPGNTSNEPRPTFSFPRAGDYQVTLTVNPGDPCSSKATSIIKVYPGFVPKFDFAGVCINKPSQFIDRTTSVHGVVDSWKWDFGDPAVGTDISNRQNPFYKFDKTGEYNVRLIVTNSKGCVDTAFKKVSIIDKPPITLAFKDTLICTKDMLQLQAAGPEAGVFSWTPNYNINDAGTATPTVYPSTTTTYQVKLDIDGCVNQESVRVRVVDFVSLTIRPDTLICSGDAVRLRATSDGLRNTWTASPATSIDQPNSLITTSRPVQNTVYTMNSVIGGCNAQKSFIVQTRPYPVANAGSDTAICFQTPSRLEGQITGARFTWSPAELLDNPQSLSPTVQALPQTQAFVLTAWHPTNGDFCPKPHRDTVLVNVRPKMQVSAGSDTSVVVNQPLQLRATGGDFYAWTPSNSLSNANIPNPVAQYNGSFEQIRYTVTVRDRIGCIDSAFLNVRIFRTEPKIFVPTAFTPNGDGKNDRFSPIAAGIQRIEYFRVFNRWGELVYEMTNPEVGWDGRVKGKEQGTGTFVWMVKAIDYVGKPFFAKGTVTLIR